MHEPDLETAALGEGMSLTRGAAGDAVKPRSEPIRLPQMCGLADQQQKRRLEGVLGILSVPQQPPTNAENHRPITPHQDGKCLLVSMTAELSQELTVLQSAAVLALTAAVEIVNDGTE